MLGFCHAMIILSSYLLICQKFGLLQFNFERNANFGKWDFQLIELTSDNCSYARFLKNSCKSNLKHKMNTKIQLVIA